MRIISANLTGQETCRGCKTVISVTCSSTSIEQAEKDLHEALEAEKWTDGLCPDCAEKKYLNQPTNENTDH